MGTAFPHFFVFVCSVMKVNTDLNISSKCCWKWLVVLHFFF